MKVDVLKRIIEKASSKKNGVFSLRGHQYLVFNNKVTHVSDKKEVYALSHGFLVNGKAFEYPSEITNSMKRTLKYMEESNHE